MFRVGAWLTRREVEAKFPDAGKNYGVPYGYAGGLIWEQILTKACEDGDLTRRGVHDELHVEMAGRHTERTRDGMDVQRGQ